MPSTTASAPLFTRFAEIGRVVVISYGPDAGKLAVIVDILDQNRALVDGPAAVTGVSRSVVDFKSLSLTDYVLKGAVDGKSYTLPRNARQATIASFLKVFGVVEKFNASAWGKKVAARKEKAESTDFSRFVLKAKKQKRSAAIKKSLAK